MQFKLFIIGILKMLFCCSFALLLSLADIEPLNTKSLTIGIVLVAMLIGLGIYLGRKYPITNTDTEIRIKNNNIRPDLPWWSDR